MKKLNIYIIEKLKINKSKLKGGVELTLFPETSEELKEMIQKEIKINGNECSLNHIDVSKITNFSFLFVEFFNICLYSNISLTVDATSATKMR